MSRTHRNTEHATIFARRIRFASYLKAEQAAKLDILEEGYPIDNRLRNAKGRIKTNFDDLLVSAYLEQDWCD